MDKIQYLKNSLILFKGNFAKNNLKEPTVELDIEDIKLCKDHSFSQRTFTI